MEKELPYSAGSGSSGTDGWSVEVRVDDFAKPIQLANADGFMVTHQWQRLPFEQGPVGVPTHAEYQATLGYTRYLSYPAAQALRWWFHAEAAKSSLAIGLRSRLVKHRVEVQHQVTAVSIHCEVGGDDRSSTMPDWGQSAPKAIALESSG